MAGSIRRRGRDSWQLRVYRGVDGNGRPRWVSTTVHGSRRHAERRLAELVAEVGHARLRSGSVGELLERWFAAASPRWAATTTSQTRSIIDCHLAPELGHLRVDKLTTTDIDDFYSHLLRSGGRQGRPLGAGTVHRIHVVLHRALAQAVRWEWIWMNPASSASPPRVPPAEVHPPDPAQVAELLAFVRERSPALFVFLRLAVSTGARRSQLLALRWCDVDFDRGALAFTRAAVTGQNGVQLRPTKTHRTYRVEIDRHTLTVLAGYRASLGRPDGRLLAGQAFVFSSVPDGSKPWLPNWVTKQFITARCRAGLEHFRLHDLRHFMATQMLAAGVPIATVSQRLSHARTSTTLNVYAHAVPGGDRAAAETLAAILSTAAIASQPGPPRVPLAEPATRPSETP
jgi:integrase